MNVTTENRVVQQIHYIINRNKNGVFHCGSNDLVYHDDFIKDLVRKLGLNYPKFKYVYTTNEERYLAVLPKYNKLPKHLLFDSSLVFSDIFKTF
jgi:dTDP-4-dehydrorhamnose reductase